MSKQPLTLLMAAVLAVGAPAAIGSSVAAAPAAGTVKDDLRVLVLSNRADLISGGDALVRVRLPRGVRPDSVAVRAGGRDVTSRFQVRPNGAYEGVVRGLRLGRSTIRATAPGHRGSIEVVNHRNGGPVFSGPPPSSHYVCQPTARDALCNEPASYRLLYKSRNPLLTDLQPYDRSNPPADVATTTTDHGVTVPFIVRREDGFQDRDRYTILQLWQPGQRWKPWKPQRQWNRKLVVTHGGNCGASYTPGEPPLLDYAGTFDGVPTPGADPSYVTALGRGFAVLSTALDNTGHNCSVAMNAESVMMAKERLVEQYGPIRYTIGTGCSGGSIAQHTVANSYPGIYQGLVTTCSYPDTLTAGAQFADYNMLRRYFEDPTRWAPGVAWLPTQMAAVYGHLTPLNAVVADEGLYKAALNPENACPGTRAPVPGKRSTRYDAETNPGGIRCSVLDLLINQLGPRPRSAWGAEEKQVGRGFGGIPFGNEGVMYGWKALLAGGITPEQFVDLNEKVGGLDVDSRATEERVAGDPASIRRAYRTGLINGFHNVQDVAILNFGGPDPGAAHDYAHAWWTEERLAEAQGHTRNRVMWFGPAPLIGDLTWANEALVKMDSWLAAVEDDRRRVPLSRKIAEDRPADVVDRCLIDELGTQCSKEELQETQTHLSTPRQEAGGPSANDIVACRLRPLTATDLALSPIPFTAGQRARLRDLFADGVCDWSVPGRGQRKTVPWLRYDAADGSAAYGGRPLAEAPRPSGTGLASRSFAPMLRG